jgi:DNA uptake protein ComE-like DNA-binding protein
MTMSRFTPISSRRGRSSTRGSVLIIVLWVCLGLVALTLYFGNSMNSERQAAENRVAEVTSRQTAAGARRYAAYVIKQYGAGGAMPAIDQYKAESVLVGDGEFWFIGRDPAQNPARPQTTEPYFALVDEASKLNLNTVTSAMLQALPLQGMTQEFADAVVAWRTANSTQAANMENIYTQLNPPRHNKGAPFESVDELRLIDGALLDLVLGEDTNRNGVMDANEDDGDQSAPRDDQNGQLLAGLLDYVTIYSSEPATSASGARRINVAQLTAQQTRQQFQTRMTQAGITQQRATQILARIPVAQAGGQGGAGGQQQQQQAAAPTSVADFMITTQITAEEFALIHTELTATTATNGIATGLVNVNTASAAVLSAIPGIGPDNATALVEYRETHPDEMTSFAWLRNVLTAAQIRQAGRYITDQSYQFTADIAAVGAFGRGYTREKVVFDNSTGVPRIIFHQDLTGYGWALGGNTRRIIDEKKNNF